MDVRRAVLVVVDVQAGFINDHSRIVVSGIVDLVRAWQSAGLPVVVAQFRNPAGSPYEVITGWTKLRSADERALAPELEPLASGAVAVIEKTGSSILTSEFEELVRTAGWTDIVLCGIDTDSCVYDSAVATYQHGYRPWLVTDACASSGGAQFHDAALMLARRNIGATQLISSNDLLAWIRDTVEVA
ncbi:cysteine hydrolase [Kitasatospora sp. RB6PN24]|uniref:isochorismatase family cysteine hydrolase n=1 Tax=Kitasatospora humi TaxID=2893891 RepID=UPI001E3CDAAE|nr:isochorismatase family cysteine hydrolase [Kitasatospora humi]MCC9312354.1 cysteine hydrolase [Kitasatospora humi]